MPTATATMPRRAAQPARHRAAKIGGHPDLNPGDVIRIKGRDGAFRFKYVWKPDQSLVCYGPVGSKAAQWCSFPAGRLSRRDEDMQQDLDARAKFEREQREAAAKRAAQTVGVDGLTPAQRAWQTRRARAAQAGAA